MKYALWPGCEVPARSTPEHRISAVAVLERLGIQVEELRYAPCTGAGILQARDLRYADKLNASTLAMAEAMGLPIMTICSTCQGILAQANRRFQERPDYLAELNRELAQADIQYRGTTQVKHLMWVLVEEYGLDRLREKVTRPLTGLRVGPFYGCYALRPSAALGFAQHPQRRTSLERVIEALGAQVVDYRGKALCCGYPLAGADDQASAEMVAQHTLEARELGAHCLATPCPLCHMNLDGLQPQAGQQRGERIGLPILHLTQLMGLALGIAPSALGFDRHSVGVRALLEALGL
jgi:succinate dehydrogenase / fumarate reductase cytochrome b subunit